MRRSIAVCAVVVGFLAGTLGAVGPASAASQTVPGVGPITKMTANNAAKKVVVKIVGDGGPSKIRWVDTTIKGKGTDAVSYEAQGAWYGADWIVSLSNGTAVVTCKKLSLTWTKKTKTWTFTVPRPCLKDLTNKVKVSATMVSTTNAMPGEAGPTKWLKRG